MKKIAYLLVLVLLAFVYAQERGLSVSAPVPVAGGSVDLQKAYAERQSDIQVQGAGRVIRLLPDDLEGSRHQKFIVKLDTGKTLLIAHNIDLAQRIDSLNTGDTVEFYGEYEWNAKGGVVHWTHRDPARHHVDGWLKVKGRIYQ